MGSVACFLTFQKSFYHAHCPNYLCSLIIFTNKIVYCLNCSFFSIFTNNVLHSGDNMTISLSLALLSIDMLFWIYFNIFIANLRACKCLLCFNIDNASIIFLKKYAKWFYFFEKQFLYMVLEYALQMDRSVLPFSSANLRYQNAQS